MQIVVIVHSVCCPESSVAQRSPICLTSSWCANSFFLFSISEDVNLSDPSHPVPEGSGRHESL